MFRVHNSRISGIVSKSTEAVIREICHSDYIPFNVNPQIWPELNRMRSSIIRSILFQFAVPLAIFNEDDCYDRQNEIPPSEERQPIPCIGLPTFCHIWLHAYRWCILVGFNNHFIWTIIDYSFGSQHYFVQRNIHLHVAAWLFSKWNNNVSSICTLYSYDYVHIWFVR